MLKQFSKIFLTLFILAGVFFSCKEDDEPTPTDPNPTDTTAVVDTTNTGDTTTNDTTTTPDPEPEPTAITILSSDYAFTAQVGSKARYKSLNQLTELPASGENQVWDLRMYESANPIEFISLDNLPVPDGSSFTSATFVRTRESPFISDFTFTEFFEISDDGYYRVGTKVDAGTANLGNGITLQAEGNEDAYNPKDLLLKFPINYNDVVENEAVLQERYTLNAPPFGISNAPVERKLTFFVKSEVVGWGKAILPQGGITDSTEVLLIKNTETVLANYFLNGNTAPATLLGALNLTEGSRNTSVFYYLISKEFGTVATFEFEANNDGVVRFPSTDTHYTTGRE